MIELYLRQYKDGSVEKEDIIFFSNNEKEVDVFAEKYSEKNGFKKFGEIWTNIKNENIIILKGNSKGIK